ncbi:uncharacterized protein LOC117121011 [Anneissia japonica]|uniref:uncharacterized protein LOC117121011 n=1 Tax=Anneissia japonica TaxID=1529436 RepID=UPI00142590ED|nr:uncharacterized protein LOC117121011 [Anneissia japonica]XP_033121997.1 uncharacterized protein LOC117121011 [Anneissia japonica]
MLLNTMKILLQGHCLNIKLLTVFKERETELEDDVYKNSTFHLSSDRTISSVECRSRHKEKEELVESDEELITSSDDYVPENASNGDNNVDRSEKEKEFDESQTPGKQNSKEISNKSKVNHGMVTVMTTDNSSISSDRTISSKERRSRHKEKEELVESDELIRSSDDYVPRLIRMMTVHHFQK